MPGKFPPDTIARIFFFNSKLTISGSIGLESRALLRIAVPLTAAYLGEFAMFVTTKIVVGKLGYHELAAVGIAGDLAFEILVVLMGMLSIVGVLCAQSEGAGNKKEAGLAVRQGMIISVVIGIPAMILVWNLDVFLSFTGQDPIVVELARPFLHHLSATVLAVLFFAVFRNFVSALSKPTVVMIISMVAVIVNYWLTLILVNGGYGIPAMGVAGAGLSTSIVSWLMFASLIFYVFKTPSLRGYGVFAERWRFDPKICREIVVLGLPVAGLVFLEAGLFVATSILSGIISAETLAAYEVVMAWVGIPFVVALGIAEATMIRVAHGVGRNNLRGARQSGILGMTLGVVALVIMVIVPLGFASYIIDIFIDHESSGSKVVSLMAVEFLAIAAIFQVFDGLQATAARALRGLKDNVAPLWIASFGYWVLGIGGGSLLAFRFDMGGAGLWWGLAMGLTATGSMLAWRFHTISRRRMLRASD
jgi:MATE family multidrug resistance protein